MSNQHFYSLFAKKLAGEASPEELSELYAYLQAHPEEQYVQEIVTNWWESGVAMSPEAEESEDARFERILHQSAINQFQTEEIIQSQKPVHKMNFSGWKKWMAAAVVAGLLFIGARYVFSSSVVTADPENEIVAKRGTKSRLLLPDGTQVWLNAESRITYADFFNDSLREVRLEGEAYFDVVKDARRPFIVHTSGIRIRVLGTAFNVKSYPQDPTIEATLVRGLIEVEKINQPQSSRIMLKPNEKLVYNKNLDHVVKTTEPSLEKNNSVQQPEVKPESISISTLAKGIADSIRVETSWVYGKLVFDGETFRELAPRMERWFNVKIGFRNEKVAGYRFTGVFEHENIEEALQALQLTASFSSTVKGNEVWIDKK